VRFLAGDRGWVRSPSVKAQLTPEVVLRAPTVDDAPALSQALRRSREHLRPWDPVRSEAFFTPAGQAARLRDQLAQREARRVFPFVLARGERIVGAATLSNVALGPFRSANLGYWIDAAEVGRGLATAAATAVCEIADREIGLHRVEAGTMIANVGSQRVLAKCGFELIGTAKDYLHINGAWRDHLIFQKILNPRPPVH
jgi:[ribosomal protein S5]-alanine N-acetyltransferase